MMFNKLITSIVFFLVFTTKALADGSTVALVQYDADSHYGDYDQNIENLTNLAMSAANDGANLIVLPEGSTYGYASSTRLWCLPGMRNFMGKTCDDVSLVAEDVRTGKTTVYWQDFASTYQVKVIFSMMEKRNGQYFNSAVVVGPDGFIGSYQKRYLYYVDQAYATPGSNLLLLDFAGQTFGVMICMDTNYSSHFQTYKSAGADAIIAPMDWDQNPTSTRAGETFFRQQAQRNAVDMYVSDQSSWDSTGFYPASGIVRYRAPLAPVAVGVDGYTLVSMGAD